MVLAMKAKVGNQSRKLVLLKLADNACDMGECWPSYQHVADQCEMAKRTAMRHIDALVKEGFVRKEQRKGGVKGNRSNLYIINRKKLVDSTIPPSDKLTPPLVTDDHQGGDRVTLPPSDPVTPRISHSLEPVNEPNKNTKKNSLDFSCWPAMPSEQTLRDWFAMRKRMKANVNQTVVNRFAKELSLAVQHGVSVDDCLAECVVRNWRGFVFAWMDKSKSQTGRHMQAVGDENWYENLGEF